MAKSKLFHMVLVISIFTICFFVGKAVYAGPGGTGPGSEEDPLVARSYLEQEVSAFNNEIYNEIHILQKRINNLKADIEIIKTVF